jgi:hypothetical protein
VKTKGGRVNGRVAVLLQQVGAVGDSRKSTRPGTWPAAPATRLRGIRPAGNMCVRFFLFPLFFRFLLLVHLLLVFYNLFVLFLLL